MTILIIKKFASNTKINKILQAYQDHKHINDMIAKTNPILQVNIAGFRETRKQSRYGEPCGFFLTVR